MSQVQKELIQIRDATATDLPFIYATWLKGLYYGNDWFREIDQETYFDRYHKAIEGILFRPTTSIKTICLKDEPDVLLAYAVYDGNRLHWAFTKPHWRKLGLMKDLVPNTINEVTHLTKVGKSIKPTHWKFNPFL